MSTPPTDHESTMKAIVYYKYGSADVLELKQIDKPAAKDNEVLVRVHAAAVGPGDGHLMRGLPVSSLRPLATSLDKSVSIY